MPGEDENKENKTKDYDFDALAKSIQEGLREEIDSKLNAHHSKLDEKLSTLRQDKSQVTDDEDDDDLDDELVVSKKDLKKLVDQKLADLPGLINKTVSDTLSVNSKRATFDDQAFSDFPMLAPNSPVYSKEFKAAVQKEMQSRVSDGDTNANPRLIYDSAAAVYARNPNYQKLKREYIEDKSRQMNNRDSSFEFTTSTKQRETGPTKSQLDLALRLGMDPEKVKQRLTKK